MSQTAVSFASSEKTLVDSVPIKTGVVSSVPITVGTVNIPKLEAVGKIDQPPVSVTLNGPAIFSLATGLATLINFVDPRFVTVVLGLAAVVVFVRNDYENFLRLGPGGIPSTPGGYIRTVLLRRYTLFNPYDAPEAEPDFNPSRGILSQRPLPQRPGPRPMVAGIAPHRQLNQHSSRRAFHALQQTAENAARKAPEKFSTGLSLVEKYGLALYARVPLRTNNYGEIFHIHNVDHSMHMALHPDDIKEVLSKGWGERHPLAWKWWFLKTHVSPHFAMVYAPRDNEELQVVSKIITASVWYNTGKEVDMSQYIERF